MTFIEADYPNQTYVKVLKDLWENGKVVSPGGKKTREFQPFIHKMNQPYKSLCSVPGRKSNPFFNMAENMWILSGKGDSEWVCSFNNKLAEYQLDGDHKEFNAAYGRRIRFYNHHRDGKILVNPYNSIDPKGLPVVDQLNNCYLFLRNDKDSRQAVVSLWHPIFDNPFNKTKDRPCNTTLYFKIREDKLNMTVSNRSNDIHLGLYGVNFVQFSMIQQFLAAALNVGIGSYTHLSDSLHVYEDSPHTNNVLNSGYNFDIYEHVNPMILKYDDVKNHGRHSHPDINLGDVLIISDEIMSENMYMRSCLSGLENDDSRREFLGKYSLHYCKTLYSKLCFMYLTAYDLFKMKFYDECYYHLVDCYNKGFEDWAIQGFEFCGRNKEFAEQFKIRRVFADLDSYKGVESELKIMEYLGRH